MSNFLKEPVTVEFPTLRKIEGIHRLFVGLDLVDKQCVVSLLSEILKAETKESKREQDSNS